MFKGCNRDNYCVLFLTIASMFIATSKKRLWFSHLIQSCILKKLTFNLFLNIYGLYFIYMLPTRICYKLAQFILLSKFDSNINALAIFEEKFIIYCLFLIIIVLIQLNYLSSYFGCDIAFELLPKLQFHKTKHLTNVWLWWFPNTSSPKFFNPWCLYNHVALFEIATLIKSLPYLIKPWLNACSMY